VTGHRNEGSREYPASRRPFGRRRRVGPGARTTEFPPDDLSPADAESRIADDRSEWMYVYAPDGRQVARFRGTADNVDLSPELMGYTDDVPPASLIRDHLIVHNHPPSFGLDPVSTYPPSSDDLALAVDRNLRAFVVLSGRYRYVVQRPADGWRGDEGLYLDEVQAAHVALSEVLGPAGPTSADASRRQHFILERLRERGWIGYERTPRDRQR
jgi:hypothetical protein